MVVLELKTPSSEGEVVLLELKTPSSEGEVVLLELKTPSSEGEVVLLELKTLSSDELLVQAFAALFERTVSDHVQSDLHVHAVGIVHYHLLVHDVMAVDSAAGQVSDQQEYSYSLHKHHFLQDLALELEELSYSCEIVSSSELDHSHRDPEPVDYAEEVAVVVDLTYYRKAG